MAVKTGRISPQLYVLPAILYVSVLTIFPFAYLFYISSFNYSLYSGGSAAFVGFRNFVDAFRDPLFQKSLVITLGFGVFVTAAEIVVGLAIALILNREGRLISFVRTSMMIPLVMTPFLILMMWRYQLQSGLGPVAYLVEVLLNNPSISFFSSVPQVYITLLVIDIWQWLPFVVTITLAGLSSIPRAPLEAADIDGATGWRRLRYITLPLLKPTLAIVLLFRLVDGFKSFEVVYLFTGGGPGTATNFMSWNIFKTGLGIVQNIGLSSAYAVVFLIVVIAIAWSLMYLLYKLQS